MLRRSAALSAIPASTVSTALVGCDAEEAAATLHRAVDVAPNSVTFETYDVATGSGTAEVHLLAVKPDTPRTGRR